jgi:hypothetical protein
MLFYVVCGNELTFLRVHPSRIAVLLSSRPLCVNPIGHLPDCTTTTTITHLSFTSFVSPLEPTNVRLNTLTRSRRILAMAATLPSAVSLGVENVAAVKLDSDSSSQIEQEELEVNLHIEGSGKRGLKRSASSSWGEGSCDSQSRKRLKDEHVCQQESKDPSAGPASHIAVRRTLIDDLTQELECGCCAALVYNPVTILPCQHSFCGR